MPIGNVNSRVSPFLIITAALFYSFLKKHLVKIRTAEQKAKESDHLKTAFLQNISHEIRTPMNGIIGFAELLKEENLTEERKLQYLKIITNSSNRLLGIVNDILDISLIETGNLTIKEKEFDLNRLMVLMLETFRPLVKTGAAFSMKKGLPDNQGMIISDEAKVRRIIENLLNNAIKFTEKGFIEFGYSLKNNELEFYVKDTGIGVAQELYGKIFERFHKAGIDKSKIYDGTGLGLAICKGNVEILKGKIWMNSKVDEGSEFFFTIPYKPVNLA